MAADMRGAFLFIPDPNTDLENWPLDWTDVTEEFKAVFDLVLDSEAWGSNFFSVEDVRPVLKLAELAGYELTDTVREYLEKMLHAEEFAKFIEKYPAVKMDHFSLGLQTNRTFQAQDSTYTTASTALVEGVSGRIVTSQANQTRVFRNYTMTEREIDLLLALASYGANECPWAWSEEENWPEDFDDRDAREIMAKARRVLSEATTEK